MYFLHLTTLLIKVGSMRLHNHLDQDMESQPA